MESTGRCLAIAALVLGVGSVASARDQDRAAAPLVKTDTGPLLLSSLGALFGPDRYPNAARRAGEQGRVIAQFTVGVDGTVTACTVTTSSGSMALDEQTCASWRLAQFEPARDPNGRGVPITLSRAVRWVLPPEAAPAVPVAATVPVPGRPPAQALGRAAHGPASLARRCAGLRHRHAPLPSICVGKGVR